MNILRSRVIKLRVLGTTGIRVLRAQATGVRNDLRPVQEILAAAYKAGLLNVRYAGY